MSEQEKISNPQDMDPAAIAELLQHQDALPPEFVRTLQHKKGAKMINVPTYVIGEVKAKMHGKGLNEGKALGAKEKEIEILNRFGASSLEELAEMVALAQAADVETPQLQVTLPPAQAAQPRRAPAPAPRYQQPAPQEEVPEDDDAAIDFDDLQATTSQAKEALKEIATFKEQFSKWEQEKQAREASEMFYQVAQIAVGRGVRDEGAAQFLVKQFFEDLNAHPNLLDNGASVEDYFDAVRGVYPYMYKEAPAAPQAQASAPQVQAAPQNAPVLQQAPVQAAPQAQQPAQVAPQAISPQARPNGVVQPQFRNMFGLATQGQSPLTPEFTQVQAAPQQANVANVPNPLQQQWLQQGQQPQVQAAPQEQLATTGTVARAPTMQPGEALHQQLNPQPTFNARTATPEQMKAYLASRGINTTQLNFMRPNPNK